MRSLYPTLGGSPTGIRSTREGRCRLDLKNDGFELGDSEGVQVIVEGGVHSGQVLFHNIPNSLQVCSGGRLGAKDATKGLSCENHEVKEESEVEQLMHSRSHEGAVEGIEIDNVRAERGSRDIRTRSTVLDVGRTKRRGRHEVVVIKISAILGHRTLSVVLDMKEIHDMKECERPFGNVGTSVGELTEWTTREPPKYGEERSRW
jgi:hypothetical protein